MDLPRSLLIKGREVYGVQVNEQTGCLHYATALDVIAIRFKCCNRYFACYSCHLALASHPPVRWGRDDFQLKAILCGRCGMEMAIHQYLTCKNCCPYCQGPFNPRCRLHWDKYFDLTD